MEGLTEEEQAVRRLALRLYGFDDSIVYPLSSQKSLRELEITPFQGAYGVAGYAIAVNGSPPRGIFIAAGYQKVFYISPGRSSSRKLQEKDTKVVLDFLKANNCQWSGL